MSAPRDCEHCGVAVDELDQQGRCPRCHELEAFADLARAEIARDMLGASLREALEWLHPEDVVEVAVTAAAAHDDAFAAKLTALYERTIDCSQARHEVRVDQALAQLLTHPRKD